MADNRGVLRRALDALYLWAGYLAGVFLIVIFLLMVLMSAGREFGLNVPSGDDFAAYSMAALAFLGLAHTFKSGEMIRVGFLIDRLSGRTRHIVEIFCLGVAVVFVAFFARHAFSLAHDSWKLNDMSSGTIAIPLWIPQTAMVFGLVVLTIAILDELLIVLSGRKPTYEKEPPKTAEELIERVAQGGGV